MVQLEQVTYYYAITIDLYCQGSIVESMGQILFAGGSVTLMMICMQTFQISCQLFGGPGMSLMMGCTSAGGQETGCMIEESR